MLRHRGWSHWRARKAHPEVREELEHLRKDLHRVRGDLGELVEALVEGGEEETRAVGRRARNGLHRRLDHLSHTYRRARRRGNQAVASAEHTMSDHPYTTASAIVGVGILIAAAAIGAGMCRNRW